MRNEMEPVYTKGRTLASSWWGKAWNSNLESYSDYSNRLPRGRTYLRNGSVVDLKIEEGVVRAKVQGSRSRPYDVKITITPVSESKRKEIEDRCAGRVSNIDALVNGNFPEDVGDLFLTQDGLFPRPSEIRFSCSCPDWASMCKHVAATLYGVGTKLDSDPTLFFSLRGIELETLIGKTAEAKLQSMLANADRPSPRILDDSRVGELFGLGLGDTPADPSDEADADIKEEPEPDDDAEDDGMEDGRVRRGARDVMIRTHKVSRSAIGARSGSVYDSLVDRLEKEFSDDMDDLTCDNLRTMAETIRHAFEVSGVADPKVMGLVSRISRAADDDAEGFRFRTNNNIDD